MVTCDASLGGVLANQLEGVEITVSSTLTIVALGSNAVKGGAHVEMGLYDEQLNGGVSEPRKLLSSTPAAVLATGPGVYPLAPPVTVLPGNYWIVSNYDAGAQICSTPASTQTNLQTEYGVGVPYGALPATITTSNLANDASQNMSFWAVVDE